MLYLWLKALHLIAVISWMAGLLYIYRLFVYHAMETENVVRSRFEVMERRLLKAITTPAGVVAVAAGIGMLVLVPNLLRQPFMHAKLTLVLGLIVIHAMAIRYRVVLLTQPARYPHRLFRVLNEVPTLLMVLIVILIVIRPWAR